MAEIVVITEKSGVGNLFAETILGSSAKRIGGNGVRGTAQGKQVVVTWTQGNLYRLALPDDTDPAFKRWSIDPLPFPLPSTYLPQEGKEGLLQFIKKEIEDCKMLILAGDIDSQGVYIGDLVRKLTGYKGDVRRAGIRTMDAARIREQFANFNELSDYAPFAPIAASEACRAILDNHIGINLSRIYTLMGREKSNQLGATLAVGRIQTSILGLLARRHYEIVNFKPERFYNIYVKAKTPEGQPVEFETNLPRLFTEEDRDSALAKLKDKDVEVLSVTEKEHSTPPPNPHKQSTLQITLGKKYGYSPLEVLAAAQENYSKGYQSYPRSDDDAVEFREWENAKDTLANVIDATDIPYDKLNFNRRGERVLPKGSQNESAHTAILPTGKKWDKEKSGIEWHVFQEVTKRFALMFLQDYVVTKSKVTAKCGGITLTVNGNVVQQLGWREFEPLEKKESVLPNLSENQVLKGMPVARASSTRAKPYYQEYELIEVLGEIHKHLPESVAELARFYTENAAAGLGSAATRGPAIAKTIEHGLVTTIKEKDKVYITPSKVGLAFHDALPVALTDLTTFSQWERDFILVSRKEKKASDVLMEYSAYIDNIVKRYKIDKTLFTFTPPITPSGYECPVCESAIEKIDRQRRVYFSCPSCGFTTPSFNGTPLPHLARHGEQCKQSNEGVRCDGTLLSYVGVSKKNNKEFKALKCQKCGAFDFN